MKYFTNVQTLSELRSQYKELLKQYHPDNGGSEEITKAINIEYENLFKALKNHHENSSDNSKSTYSKNMYDWENDKALRDILSKIINFSGIEIEIIGQWIWCFNSYNYHKELKELGFKFGSQKRAWYYHTEAFKKKTHKIISLDDSRNYYGTTKIKTNNRELLEA